MLWSEKAGGTKVAGNPLPPKIAALLRESWWFGLVAIALYLLLVLLTYHQGDPGWSHSVRTATVRNAGGVPVSAALDELTYRAPQEPAGDPVDYARLLGPGLRESEPS